MKLLRLALPASALALFAFAAPAQEIGHQPACSAPSEFARLSEPLYRVSYRLSRGGELRVLAFGSSSTAGVGASSPDRNYPSRLEAELTGMLPGVRVRVVNRGVSGEDAAEMLARLDRDVLSEAPDLVLWQVGTNALMRKEGIAVEAPIIREGLRRIQLGGADVILIDPQYAPKVLRDPDAHPMVDLLSRVAREMGAPVFRRFALMQHWHEVREISFADMLSPDLLHMNDWSYRCLADRLAKAIVATAAPSTNVAGRPATPPWAPVLPASTPSSADRKQSTMN